MDEALALPTEKAVQIALRTQQILAYESGVGDVIDPLGGSYFIEDLTNRLEAEAREYIATIDAMGGALTAIENGFQQKEIQEAAYRYQMQVESRERIIVGVNEFVVAQEEQPELLRVDPAIGERQVQKLRKLRAKRDGAAVERILDRLEQAARGTDNLLPIMVEAVENRVTLGEISHRLRKVWGEQREPVFI
jgi:methylmalonyl-CoA mutase N-terminal domain/subunit